MNAKSIKNKIFKQSSISLDEIIVEKSYSSYAVVLRSGLSDNERQQMTGDQVNEYRRVKKMKIQELADLFNVEPGTTGIFI